MKSHNGPNRGKSTAPAMLSRRGVVPPEMRTFTFDLAVATSSSVGALMPIKALDIVQWSFY